MNHAEVILRGVGIAQALVNLLPLIIRSTKSKGSPHEDDEAQAEESEERYMFSGGDLSQCL